MAFQRSYSKVWWGSDNLSSNGNNYYSHYGGQQQHPSEDGPSSLDSALPPLQRHQTLPWGSHSDYNTLDLHGYHRLQTHNLSCIQEGCEDEQNNNNSMTSKLLLWQKHDSPGSLRSQDSGFSDNEEATAIAAAGATKVQTPVKRTPSNVESPVLSVRSVATPPTVVRRVGNSSFYSPLVSVTRRISFNSKADGDDNDDDELEASRTKLFQQLDSMHLTERAAEEDDNGNTNNKTTVKGGGGATPPRPTRRKRVIRSKAAQPLSPAARRCRIKAATAAGEADSNKDDEAPPAYNNETIVLGEEAPPPYNNETVYIGSNITTTNDNMELSPLRPHRHYNQRFTANTSTPIAKRQQKQHEYSNSNSCEFESTTNWMNDQRWNCEQEVMCTLQTKSIAQVAYTNFTITTSTVVKLMRQLQQQALSLQSHFERTERVLGGQVQQVLLPEALSQANQLLLHLSDFIAILERRVLFFSANEARAERRRYEQQLEQIRIIARDTRYSLERQHYINLESLLDDIQLLKRHTLISLRLIFERLAHVLVVAIEQSQCDLLLRANINMLATLMGIDYDGFASLTDAFVQNEAVRALLIVVLDHKLSSVRALALRALATLCCAPAAIAQLGQCGGIDIVRDILQPLSAVPRGEIERREAVSLLAQITAAWHGPEHRVSGLRDCAESLIAGLVALLTPDCECSQTLLLCAAALNNLSRMEITSHYSIMSNEAIRKLITTLEHQQNTISIFHYEQIVAMLHNMSMNKKCHMHLANGMIINFITSIYQLEFYKTYNSRAECDSQRRTIKAILYTLTRLASDSQSLSVELLEQWHLPEILQQSIAIDKTQQQFSSSTSSASLNISSNRDISQLARHLLQLQSSSSLHRQEQLMLQSTPTQTTQFTSGHQIPEAQTTPTRTPTSSIVISGMKFNLTRQESFV